MPSSLPELIGLGADNPIIEGDGIYLRAPRAGDYRSWATLRGRSRKFLEPWEPSWTEDELTRKAYRSRLRSYVKARRNGLGLSNFLFRADDHSLLGGINISHIRRGAAQSGTLGYWMGETHAGKGWMRKGLAALVDTAFDEMGLNRLEAAVLPENEVSIGLLKGAGFRYEGRMRGYLRINGAWRDHNLYALLSHDRDHVSGSMDMRKP